MQLQTLYYSSRLLVLYPLSFILFLPLYLHTFFLLKADVISVTSLLQIRSVHQIYNLWLIVFVAITIFQPLAFLDL